MPSRYRLVVDSWKLERAELMTTQSTRVFVLVSTDWHRQIHEKSFPNGVLAVDVKALSFRNLWRLRGATVFSFVDKYPLMPLVKRLSAKLILVEEGLGFYRSSPKIPRSIGARVQNFLLGIGAIFIIGRFVGYNTEQGKADLADVIIVRNPELFDSAFRTLRKRSPSSRIRKFDCYFAPVPRCNQPISVFWGCDYKALDLEDQEIAAFRLAKLSEPDLIYLKHPKSQANPELSEITSVKRLPLDGLKPFQSKLRAQYTLASGAIIDERFIGERNFVVSPQVSDNGRCIADLFGGELVGETMLQIALPDSEGKLLKEVIECELSGAF